MTILANSQPFPLFFDKVGEPLNGGFVYFGQPNQNPETAPITIYWDAAGTQPAPQPLRTLNGCIVRNGTPSLVYVSGDYSLTVKDRNGAQVVYVQTSASFGGSQQVLAALADSTSASQGSGLVGFGSVSYPANTIGWAVQQMTPDIQASSVLRLGRTSPHSNLDWFTSLFTVSQAQGPGNALLAQDIADVFQNTFGAAIGSTASYVHPDGNDGNAGTSWRSAFLTVAQALRNTTNGTIYIWPGTYALSDFRYTDSYGDHPKKIIAPFGGVTLRVPGDAANSATWTLDGDYGGMYTMCISSTNKPVRLLRSDLQDKFGNKMPMPIFADRLSLASQNFGWCYEAGKSLTLDVSTSNGINVLTVVSGGTKQAAVGMSITGTGIPGGATITAVSTNATVTISANATATNASITATATGNLLTAREAMSADINATTKANMDIVYGDSSGDMRTLLYSTTSYWEGITFYGYISVLNASGQAIPQFWAKNCTFAYGNTHSLLAEGGYIYTQDCVSKYGAADGGNYNTLNSIVARGVEINFETYYQGDVLTYGTSMTLNPQGAGTNKNGSSNHDSYVVRVNGEHQMAYGPMIADTASSYSWFIGVEAGMSAISPNVAPSVPRYGILNQGNNAWLDGCSATGNDVGFNADSSANVMIFNSFGTQSATNGGVFTSYTPN